MTKYRTIVADPPWPYPEGFGVSRIPKGSVHDGRRTPLPYAQMPLDEIHALPVADLADPDGCHLYLWTTNRYLRAAFDVLDAWGFRFGQVLVWCKTPMGIGPGGAWSQTTEYVLTARCGSLRNLQRFNSSWFSWPRMGKAHSRKPEAFLDMVEATSPGPLPRAVRQTPASRLGHLRGRSLEPRHARSLVIFLSGHGAPRRLRLQAVGPGLSCRLVAGVNPARLFPSRRRVAVVKSVSATNRSLRGCDA